MNPVVKITAFLHGFLLGPLLVELVVGHQIAVLLLVPIGSRHATSLLALEVPVYLFRRLGRPSRLLGLKISVLFVEGEVRRVFQI